MKFIQKLSNVLNELHGLDWNIRSLENFSRKCLNAVSITICESFVNNFIFATFYDLRSCTIMDHSFLDLQVKDFDDFSKSYHDNNFNNIIYSYILKKIDTKK